MRGGNVGQCSREVVIVVGTTRDGGTDDTTVHVVQSLGPIQLSFLAQCLVGGKVEYLLRLGDWTGTAAASPMSIRCQQTRHGHFKEYRLPRTGGCTHNNIIITIRQYIGHFRL